jgi:hypothetical protein
VHTWAIHSSDNNNVHIERNGNKINPRSDVDTSDNNISIFNNTWKIKEIKTSKL